MPHPPSRRAFVCGSASVILSTLSCRTPAQLRQTVQARIIVDNDFAGDPDGLIALAHQCASKAARTVLVTSSTLDPGLAAAGGLDPATTAAAGAKAARELLGTMGIAASAIAVRAGSETTGPNAATPSAAVEAIIAEAMRPDPLPLIFACGGPLTNLAQALRLRPEIARRMKLVWIGGDAYPAGGREYNLNTDVKAAQAVFATADLPLWQVPMPAYAQCLMSIEEFNLNLRSLSATTEWLYRRYASLPPFVKLGGVVGFGDSALVLLSSLSDKSSRARDRAARSIMDDGSYGPELPGRTIRVFDQLDVRLLLADFAAAMRGWQGHGVG